MRTEVPAILSVVTIVAIGCQTPAGRDFQAILDTSSAPAASSREATGESISRSPVEPAFRDVPESGKNILREPTAPGTDTLDTAERLSNLIYEQRELRRQVHGPAAHITDAGSSDTADVAAVRLAADEGVEGVLPAPLVPQPGLLDMDQPDSVDDAVAAGEPESITPSGLTLDDLQQLALQCNPTLVQATMAVRAAEGRYVQDGLYPNPAIGYMGGDMGQENTSGQQGMTLSQTIVTRGKLRLARAVASYGVEQNRYAFAAQQQRVLNDVRAGYYEVLLAQRTVQLNERLVRISDEVVEVNKKLRVAQEVSRPVLLQSQIQANTARLGLIASQKAYEAAWRRLATVIGQPELQPQPVLGEPDRNLPEFTWEESLGLLLTQSPELARAYTAAEQAHQEVARQCAERWPNFQVATWVKHDGPTDDTLLDVQLAVPLPIFDRNQGGIAEAEATLVAAQREVQRLELSLQNRLATTFERYAIAKRQVEIYTDSILPDARESLELAQTGYREGEFGYLDLLVAQTTYFDVSLSSLDTLKELWARSVELEGLLLTGGLERPE